MVAMGNSELKKIVLSKVEKNKIDSQLNASEIIAQINHTTDTIQNTQNCVNKHDDSY